MARESNDLKALTEALNRNSWVHAAVLREYHEHRQLQEASKIPKDMHVTMATLQSSLGAVQILARDPTRYDLTVLCEVEPGATGFLLFGPNTFTAANARNQLKSPGAGKAVPSQISQGVGELKTTQTFNVKTQSPLWLACYTTSTATATYYVTVVVITTHFLLVTPPGPNSSDDTKGVFSGVADVQGFISSEVKDLV